ncbi:hypothetical protein HYDPIDRAFT_81833 [Hydnomerulius pinastri MD-312]|nr:hypothetical protein HYDPIDRAFT_81833 [Hydnomerulius pinastri MD-312]
MPADTAPPPLYSQHGPHDDPPPMHSDNTEISGLQLLIAPAADGVNFQKGYAGAEGERAALEGEIHVKGAQPGMWKKVSVSLRTTESAQGHEIELGAVEIDLSSYPLESDATMPTSFPFAMPLTQDVPQCIHTPHSSLTHVLTATLHPADPARPVVSKDLVVHTRRYTSHTHTIGISPETHVLDHPARVEVEVPRSTFRVGEPIPVYVTVPPPPRELVIDEGLRLRNVKTELLRVVEVKRVDEHGLEGEWQTALSGSTKQVDGASYSLEGPSSAALSSAVEKPKDPLMENPSTFDTAYRTVVSRSGASCRFHTSNPIRLRFILHQSSPSTSPSDYRRPLNGDDYGYMETPDPQCISITQSTLLHRVSFCLNVHISFVDTASRTERLYTIPIPVIIIPPPAPLPEVEEWVDAAYQKKHDRPPLRTVRHEDSELSAPLYHEGEAGPSYTQNGAPPPFEDRDVPPPPFFPSEASTSSGLPTFQESENEIYVPTNPEDHFATPMNETAVIGEGVIFGFTSSQQFDGHSDTLHRSSTPPPSVEQAAQDPDVTDLADISQPHLSMGLILEQQQPPPPPPLDDPSDPPPSIDSEFRSPASRGAVQSHPCGAVSHLPFAQIRDHHDSLSPPGEIMNQPPSHVHAPPPYLTPNEQEQVTRPPPYMDFIPSHGH